jgi:nitrate reductase molybdenum cofactor assembly chaperone NarJ/NarW
MAKTFKALSALLSYPSEELQAAAPDLRAVLKEEGLVPGFGAEGGVPKGPAASLSRLIDEIETGELFDLQERYVLLFDRTRSLSLHLFEHIHGESRDRGQALVDLGQLYERHGLFLDVKELPDYLPLFLEFLSTLPFEEARALLAEPLHIAAALEQRLRKRKSAYASVFWALQRIANAKPSAEGLKSLSGEEDSDPNDLEALDRIWAEEPVTFGPAPAAGACSGDRVAARIRAALRPASPDAGPFPKH